MTQAGKQLYLVANWKSNKTLDEALEFINVVSGQSVPPETQAIICPSYPYLYPLNTEIKNKSLSFQLGAQDISPFPMGTYTGAVAASMIQDICSYVIVGHSERRKYFHETNDEVARKLRAVLDTNMTPILCIDEPYLESQLAFFESGELKKIIIAYEPITFISDGTPGKTDSPEHANEVAQKIHRVTDVNMPVIYGGSVSEETVKSFTDQSDIQGVLVGGASLNPQSWSAIVKAVI